MDCSSGQNPTKIELEIRSGATNYTLGPRLQFSVLHPSQSRIGQDQVWASFAGWSATVQVSLPHLYSVGKRQLPPEIPRNS